MPLQNSQYETIMRQYNQKQNRHLRERDEHRQIAYARIPRLREIESEIASVSADAARSLLLGKRFDTGDLKSRISELTREQHRLLKEEGFPENYLELAYDCPLCEDTGFVDGQKCTCFKKAEIELFYAESHLQEILQKENFQHFSFDYYSDKMYEASDPSADSITPRESAIHAYDAAQDFVRRFDQSSDNLLICGATGVGKSFLSHCIAHELLESAHYVLYFSSTDLFQLLAERTFHQEDAAISAEVIYDCDLLIIDDLGTELTNGFVASQLFVCINERLQRRKSTIISTNLSLGELYNTYSERTVSRITSNYQMIRLLGEDIRLQKLN